MNLLQSFSDPSCEMSFDPASGCYRGMTDEGQHYLYVPADVFHHAHTDLHEPHLLLPSCEAGWWVDRDYDAPELGIRTTRIPRPSESEVSR